MTQTADDPLPSITEREATGAIKALYTDIKAVTGVPVVNLIYRHLATLPGCLDWSWGVLRPVYASGTVAVLAEQLMDDLALPDLPRLTRPALRTVGVDANTERIIVRVLDAYNRTNPMNMIALSTLLAALDPSTSVAATSSSQVDTSPPHGAPVASEPLPSLLNLQDMDDDCRALVQTLNSLSPQGKVRTMASMYRQLAHWPSYLALALTLLHPVHVSGQLQACVEQAQTRALDYVQGLIDKLSIDDTTSPKGASREALQTALTDFTTKLIVEMLPVGKLLREAMP